MNKELAVNMNQLLADLNVLYRKLQNYHWNIKGKTFFTLHAKLEEYYDFVNEEIDEVAEKILMIGGQPLGRMKDYLEISGIREADNVKVSAREVVENVEKDFKCIKAAAVKLKEQADEAKVYEVSSMADDLIKEYSKAIWMLGQSRMED